jgi:site-specific DNA-methyltransferase (adenine-specific)
VQPYWSGDGIALYLGDCRDIDTWLTADVLVTDPPYGRGWKQGHLAGKPGSHNRGSAAHAGIAGDRDPGTRDTALTLWGPGPAVVFGDLMLGPPAGTKQVLIWAKPPGAGARGAMGGFRRDAEAIYLIGAGWPSGLGGASSVLRSGARSQGNPSSVAGRHGHPHAKPDDLMQTLIAACPAGVIAEPFAGSGSTLVAARMQGRAAIGVEVHEPYAEICARRLDQGIMDFGSTG